MWLLPRMRPRPIQRRRHVNGVMQPAEPAGRHLGSFGNPIVDDPASLDPERRVDLAAFGAKIAVAEFVVADVFAVKRRPQLGAKRLAIPPGEYAQQKGLHRRSKVLRYCCGWSCYRAH